MEGIFNLVIGILLLIIVCYDFFYTTISTSGAAFITKNISTILHHVLQVTGRVFGRKIFSLSGVWINLPMLILWLLLFWIGLFLVFSYNPEGVVSSSGKVASTVERFYFTGYVISTLGLGDFKPVTPFFEIITSCFSLLGFIVITTSMTYFISISSAVIEKRSISLLVRNLGKSPQEVVSSLCGMKVSQRVQQLMSLQQMIDKHFNNHMAYPVIHFYSTPKKDTSLSVNLAILDETLSIIIKNEELKDIHSEIEPLRKAITNFLDYVQEKYNVNTESAPEIQWEDLKLPKNNFGNETYPQEDLISRRKILGGLLKGENWSWKDIYPKTVIKDINN